jgi:DNA uptake protein ComE-like DNA-binding protein
MRALDGFTEKDAQAIIRTREEHSFMTAAELLQASPVSKAGAAMLKQAGIGDENDGLMRLF